MKVKRSSFQIWYFTCCLVFLNTFSSPVTTVYGQVLHAPVPDVKTTNPAPCCPKMTGPEAVPLDKDAPAALPAEVTITVPPTARPAIVAESAGDARVRTPVRTSDAHFEREPSTRSVVVSGGVMLSVPPESIKALAEVFKSSSRGEGRESSRPSVVHAESQEVEQTDEWRHQFVERIMDDLKVLGLPVNAIEYHERRAFLLAYSGGRLVVHAQITEETSERVRDHILDWVRHFNRRGMIIRQIRYPEKFLACEKGVLSIPPFRPAAAIESKERRSNK